MKIFISYADKDREWVSRLVEALRAQGLDVFDPDEINLGDIVVDRLEEGLRESNYIVSVVSDETMNANQAVELGIALGSRKTLIPIVAEDIPREAIPGPIRIRRYLQKGDPIRVAEQIAKSIAAEQKKAA